MDFVLSCHSLVWFGFKIYRLYLGVWSLGSLLISDHLLWNGHSHFTKVRLAHNGLDDKFCCKRTGQLRRGQSKGDRIWKKTAEWNYVANTTLSSLELLKIKWKFEWKSKILKNTIICKTFCISLNILYESFKSLVLWTFYFLCLGEVVLLALASISKDNWQKTQLWTKSNNFLKSEALVMSETGVILCPHY